MCRELVSNIIILILHAVFSIVNTILLFYTGLTLLKVRIAAWRYDRGTRSLEQNLLSTEPKALEIKQTQNIEDDDDDDIPSLLEDIIQELMEGLKDTDIIVR